MVNYTHMRAWIPAAQIPASPVDYHRLYFTTYLRISIFVIICNMLRAVFGKW